MKRLALLTAVMGLALCLLGGAAWGDNGFYVIAGGGPSGKVLKTEVFTSETIDTTLGTGGWEKLASPQWTYTKVSSTSYLVITYQDIVGLKTTVSDAGSNAYQLRVNDQPSAAMYNGAQLFYQIEPPGLAMAGRISNSATGVWFGVPKGDAVLSIWHTSVGCMNNYRNDIGQRTSVSVMEIENN
jgi:hypothetical protein